METNSYDGRHKLLSDVIGSLSNSWNYGPGDGESSATWGSAGSPGVSNLTPVDAQGLNAAVSGQPTAIGTDPTGNPTKMILDGAGRVIQEIQADGSKATWTRDPLTGYVLSQTDFLGRITTFQNDAQGYVTSETLPSGPTLTDSCAKKETLTLQWVTLLRQKTIESSGASAANARLLNGIPDATPPCPCTRGSASPHV